MPLKSKDKNINKNYALKGEGEVEGKEYKNLFQVNMILEETSEIAFIYKEGVKEDAAFCVFES